jgi:hypothetical protein
LGRAAAPEPLDGPSGTLRAAVATTPPDLLDSIRQQLRQRLAELRPLVAQHERLQALGTETATAGASLARSPAS